MDAFLRQHSALVREQDPAEEVVLPVPVPAALHAVLERMPGYATAAPPRWQDVLRLHSTRTLHPTLFAGLDAPALVELQSVLDFYALPRAWSEWTAQEAAARAGPGNPIHTPSALTPVVTTACGAARRALELVFPRPRVSWAGLRGGGLPDEPTPFDPLHARRNRAVWNSAARVPHAAPRTDHEYALHLALGSRTLVAREGWENVPGLALAAVGDVDGLRWARAAGCYMDNELCIVAADNGHLATLQWLVEEVADCSLSVWVCDAAAGSGCLEVVQWAHSKGAPLTEQMCVNAAASGSLPVLQWLAQAGCPWDSRTCAAAASHGHLEVLQWLVQAGCPWDSHTCRAAAAHCHLEVLQWARSKGAPWWAEDICAQAAAAGHLPVLEWLVQAGCPLDERVCRRAATHGHLAVLQWLRAHGCPWHAETVCEDAARLGHVELLEWLTAQGCLMPPRVCEFAAQRGNTAALLAMKQSKCKCRCALGRCPRDNTSVRRPAAKPPRRRRNRPRHPRF